jgi:hypothetical protein
VSIEAKIDQCVDIWIEKGSLSPGHKKQKFNEIFGKVQSGALTEHDLDVFIEGWKPETGKYNYGR